VNVSTHIPRMRTAKGVAQIIRAADPGSAISEYHIRKIIKSGNVKVVRSGKRMLVDADQVIAILMDGCALEEA